MKYDHLFNHACTTKKSTSVKIVLNYNLDTNNLLSYCFNCINKSLISILTKSIKNNRHNENYSVKNLALEGSYDKQTLFTFFDNIPKDSQEELFQTIFQNKNVKIERIVSCG